jgi:tripartite-type tricarboxylate transporter receptor subunit TctC
MRTVLSAVAAIAFGFLAGSASAQDYPWKPDRPINLIVPWAAGGSTDQMARIVATELESELKQKVVVVNQPGRLGFGRHERRAGRREGRLHLGGRSRGSILAATRVLGLLDSQLKDWNLFFAVANVNTISANPNAPFKDFGQFLDSLKRTARTCRSRRLDCPPAGHNFMESVKKAAPDIEYRHVTYDGGNPAVLATVSGETQAAAQLLVEMSEMIKGKRLIPLAVQADKPVTLEGFGEIPPVTKWLPNMPAPLNYFGIWVPKGAPEPVVQTMDMIWKKKIANSDALRKYAAARAALFTPISGQEAEKEAMKMTTQTVWLYFDAGRPRSRRTRSGSRGRNRPVAACPTRPCRCSPTRSRCRRARIFGSRRASSC